MSFVAVYLTVMVGIVGLGLIITASLMAASKSGPPIVGAHRRIRVLYSVATIMGGLFALAALQLFPTIYVNATKVPGLLAALGPILAGIVFVDVAALGEAFWPKQKGQRRGAYLTRRPAMANAARVPKWATVVWSVLLVVTLTFTGLTASSSGESVGRSIGHPDGHGYSGPYPGWVYGIPMIFFGIILVLFAILVLRQIARRPAVVGASPDEDEDLRRMSATYLVKGVQLALATSLAGILLFAGLTANNAGWWWGSFWTVLSGLVAVAGVIVVLWRGR